MVVVFVVVVAEVLSFGKHISNYISSALRNIVATTATPLHALIYSSIHFVCGTHLHTRLIRLAQWTKNTQNHIHMNYFSFACDVCECNRCVYGII